MWNRHKLARWTGRAGQPAAAHTLYRELVVDHTRVLGADHPDTLTSVREHVYWAGKAGL
ncbi:tetratricopeptide repeat protein [Streptomyces sp. NBC_01551]|nr:tetratricopeptide repeat protein [Streptomyces sp. NBC_01551]